MDIGIVVAIANNGIIGNHGKLPWHISEDLKHFKKLTLGNPIIMGRKTYESIGHPLDGRKNIVLSSNSIENVDTAHSIDEAITIANHTNSPHAYIIGGASVYRESIKFANFMEITEVHRNIDGDIYFPDIDFSSWVETKREDKIEYSFVSYKRK